MKLILSLLILVSSSVFAEGSTSETIAGIGAIGQTLGGQMQANQEYKQALIAQEEKLTKNGIKADLCKQCTGQSWDTLAETKDSGEGDCANPTGKWFDAENDLYSINCQDNDINNPSTKDPDCRKSKCATGCESYTDFAECEKDTKCKTKAYSTVKNKISTKIDDNIAMCDTYLKLKKSSGLGWAVAGDLLNLATLLGGALLAPGCDTYCKDYKDKDQIRCLCQHTSKDGKPCLEPSSSQCKNADVETCAEQMAKLGTTDAALLKACECGQRNSVDPRGGWHLDDKGTCTNNNNNNNNNNLDNGTFDAGYEKTYGDGNTNNNNAAATAAATDTSKPSSKSSLGAASAGNRGASAGNNNGKEKTSLSSETGHGAGRGSNAMAGGNDPAGGGGAGQDFKVKKGAKVKDIAKADGEDIFKLVSTVYKTQIDANALDSIRKVSPIKKLDRKTKSKKA